jgi:hypothetical protein
VLSLLNRQSTSGVRRIQRIGSVVARSVSHIVLHHRRGPLFQVRFKAVLHDPQRRKSLGSHLNNQQFYGWRDGDYANCSSVSRPLRIVMENGGYHVMNRGIDARRSFPDNKANEHFRELLARMPKRFGLSATEQQSEELLKARAQMLNSYR